MYIVVDYAFIAGHYLHVTSQRVGDHKQAVLALQPFTHPNIFNSTHAMREALELLNAVLPLAVTRNNFTSAKTVSDVMTL